MLKQVRNLPHLIRRRQKNLPLVLMYIRSRQL
jgi:hypothetical protein